jgi:hypothetical protein
MKKIKITTTLNFLLVSFIFLVFLLISFSVYLSNELSGLSSLIYYHPFTVTNEIKDIQNNLDNMLNSADNIKYDESTDVKTEIVKITVNEKNIERSLNVVDERFSGNRDLPFKTETPFYEYKEALRNNLMYKI